MSGAPERAGLTSAALCPDGAAGGVVGRTEGARVPSGPRVPGSLNTFVWVRANTAPPLALRTSFLPTGCPRGERRPRRPPYGFHQREANVREREDVFLRRCVFEKIRVCQDVCLIRCVFEKMCV